MKPHCDVFMQVNPTLAGAARRADAARPANVGPKIET
jgi:hypothetical protein